MISIGNKDDRGGDNFDIHGFVSTLGGFIIKSYCER